MVEDRGEEIDRQFRKRGMGIGRAGEVGEERWKELLRLTAIPLGP